MITAIIIGAFIAVIVIVAVAAHFEITRNIKNNDDHWYHD